MTRATVSRINPRAEAICDRCGFRYNHVQLQWQMQWSGPKLQNLRLLVCKSCLDKPQEQLRTVILPPDPVPIDNPRPEYFDLANNPNSPIGQAPVSGILGSLLQGSNIGTLIGGAGTYSAFMGSSQKKALYSAYLGRSGSSFANWLGKHWGAIPNASNIPTTVDSTGLSLTATAFEARAPTDMAFLRTGTTNYAFQGSSDGSTWTTLASGTTTGTVGETVSNSNLAGGSYSYHRFAVSGDGSNSVGVAYLAINTNRGTDIA